VQAAYWYLLCDLDVVLRPQSTEELAKSIRELYQESKQTGVPVKVRATREAFHSSAAFPCPTAAAGTELADKASTEDGKKVKRVGVMTEGIAKTLEVYPKKYQLRLGAGELKFLGRGREERGGTTLFLAKGRRRRNAKQKTHAIPHKTPTNPTQHNHAPLNSTGMTLNDYMQAATDANMSVQVGSTPVYGNLTIGGILTTSAHGSGDRTISALADTVKEIIWIDGMGAVRRSARDSDEGRAIAGGLGLTGIVTELVLQLTPPTHTQLITRYLSSDANMLEDLEMMLKVSPHILVFWRPDQGLYSAFLVRPVDTSVPTDGDPYMTLLPNFAGRVSQAKAFKFFQEDIFNDLYPLPEMQYQVSCPTVAYNSVVKTWASSADGSPVLDVVGRTNRMQVCECGQDCPWNSPVYNGTAEDVELTMEYEHLPRWLDDMRAVIHRDLKEDGEQPGRCMGPGYIWLRFGRGTDDNIATMTGMKRPVFVQSTWLKSRSAPQFAQRYGFVLDLLELVTLCKYQGRPHWGKNHDRTFLHPDCPIKALYPNFDKQLAAAAKFDPLGMFEPGLWTKLKGEAKEAPIAPFPRCALSRKCFCSEDEHCAEGHACVPSVALPEFKVCKPSKEVAMAQAKVKA
jgi:hypothetical protein